MSNSIEDEIVAMKFDNRQFESGVATSLGTIDKLKQSLQFKDAGAGLSDLNRNVAGFNMNPMEGALSGISNKWLAMKTIAITAIANITNRVVDAGLRLAKSFTIQPILDGYHEYETNLNSIQTIMANTGKDVKTVNKYLNELNHYSDRTIYNFSQMAKNIGTFTAAGVDLKTSTASIKGIANLAALSGSSADQASNAMYQLSQAIASGKVGLQDWNSVVNAGMGGKVFQQALANTAQAMGTLEKGAVKLEGPMKQLTINGNSFRNSIAAKAADGSEPWLTSDVLTKTLTQFTGDLKEADIVAMGFTKHQAQAIMQTAKTAQQAATRVKTFSQLIGVIKESIGSGWAMIFQHLFGNFEQASKLWTGVSNNITGAISKIFKSIDKLLTGWAKLGGYKDLWEGIGNIFKILGNIIGPFIDAFREVFPVTKDTGAGLAKATHGFAAFTGWLVKVTDKLDVITPVLVFFFKAIKSGFGAIGALVHIMAPFVAVLGELASKAAGIISDGAEIAKNLIEGFLQGLNVGNLKAAIVSFAQNIIAWFKETLGIHSPATEMIPVGYNVAAGIAVGIGQGFMEVLHAIGDFFSKMGSAISGAFKKVGLQRILEIFNALFLGGFYLQIRKFFGSFNKVMDSFANIGNSTAGTFKQLTSNLKTMQTKVRSEIIRNIAISIGILAASAFVLAQLDGKKLAISLGAITGMMTSLLAVMFAFGGGGKGKHIDGKAVGRQVAQMLALSAALVGFATAIGIMAGAVALLGQLDMKTIAKGMAGVAGIVAIIAGATAVLGKTGGGATIIAAAGAMVIMAFGLSALAAVLKLYSGIDWSTILVGGAKAVLVIAGLGLALKTFGAGSFAGSGALLVASGALLILAKALQMLSKIGLWDLIKAVAGIAGAMFILAAASVAMSFAEGGALTMLTLAGAIVVLAHGIKMLSKIPWSGVLKSLLILGVVFGALAAAAFVLAPVLPVMAALASILLILSASVAVLGAGMWLFATGLALMATIGQAGFAVLVAGLTSFLELLPVLITQFGLSVGAVVDIIESQGPRFVHAIGSIIMALLDEIIRLIPKLTIVAIELIGAFFTVLMVSRFRMVAVALALVLALVNGLADNIGELVDAAVRVITQFSDALTSDGNMDKIVAAAFDILGEFLSAVGKYIHDHWNDWVEKGREIGEAIKQGMEEAAVDVGMSLFKKTGVFDIATGIAGLLPKGPDDPKSPPPPPKPNNDPQPFPSGGNKPPVPDRTMSELGQRAADSMREGFNKQTATVPPTVSPVLDLSELEKQATTISGQLPKAKIEADVSRKEANDVAASQPKHEREHEKIVNVNFKQEIKSKDPINHTKVYRSTKSGLALVKEEVKNQK